MKRAANEPPEDALRAVGIMADACLLIDSARKYGLVSGGPDIDIERCEELIERAKAAGHTWTREEREYAVRVIIANDREDQEMLL